MMIPNVCVVVEVNGVNGLVLAAVIVVQCCFY